MHSLTLLAVGKLKEPYFTAAANEYAKRLSAYCKCNVIELPEHRLPEQPSDAEIASGLAKEAERLLAHVPKGAWLCVLTPEGKQLSSEQLAQTLQGVLVGGKSHLCAVIGSSYGLDPRVKEAADLRLSFSPMTFPHHLMRVMALEQLYRAQTIIAGARYHK